MRALCARAGVCCSCCVFDCVWALIAYLLVVMSATFVCVCVRESIREYVSAEATYSYSRRWFVLASSRRRTHPHLGPQAARANIPPRGAAAFPRSHRSPRMQALCCCLPKPPPKSQVFVGPALAERVMTPRGKSELKKLFAECDRDGDGAVTQSEWRAACTKPTLKRVFSGADADELANAFQAVDTDGSGTITWDEFEAASRSLYMSRTLAAATVSDSGKAGLQALFKSLDENGDGTVSRDEWAGAIYSNEKVCSELPAMLNNIMLAIHAWRTPNSPDPKRPRSHRNVAPPRLLPSPTPPRASACS